MLILIGSVSGLIRSNLHRIALDILIKGLIAADPYKAVFEAIKVLNDRIYIRDHEISINRSKIHVVGFGKASENMARTLYDILGDRIYGGIVITPSNEGGIKSIIITKGGHPLPSANTERSSAHILDYLHNQVFSEDIVFVLVPGEGSALFEIPEEGITLNETAWIYKKLMRRGVNIVELNIVRKRLSRVKGGKLLRHIPASKVISLIISDVVDDRIDIIASGPTVPDTSSAQQAIEILKHYKLWNDLPEHIKKIFIDARNDVSRDTPRADDTIFRRVTNIVLASNTISLKHMTKEAEARGFGLLILTSMMEGEARKVGRFLSSIIKSIYIHGIPLERPVTIFAGGETTVTVKGSGISGRTRTLFINNIQPQGSEEL